MPSKRAAILVFLVLASPSIAADPRELAARIDALVSARWKEAKVEPAPPADDAEFLRRLYLDVTGRIPSANDVQTFLTDPSPDKRRKVVDELLDTPRYAEHFANIWRMQLVPEVTANAEARYFQPGFEAWLRDGFRRGVGYDQLVRDLLTTPLVGKRQTAQSVFRESDKPNPFAFFAVKDARPENLAATTTRLFLGIQIECAQCHDHPFASWSRKQFWNQAAFFAGIRREGEGIFAPLRENVDIREVIPTDQKKTVAVLFLDDTEPDLKPKVSSRVALADWVTSKDNPYFAKATVNRLWGQFFGRGLVDPVDDFNDENPASHPELLDTLAQAFVDSDFDLRHIIRGIVLSKAYQLSSARTSPSQDEPRLFARMSVKGLTGEQFFDSLALATGYREPARERDSGGRERPTARSRFLTEFAPQGRPSDPETSILQALTLMNGKFLNDATTASRSPTLQAVVGLPDTTNAERVESLYLVTLGRKPTEAEKERLVRYVEKSGTADEARRFSDVFWMLLNSAEFRLNH